MSRLHSTCPYDQFEKEEIFRENHIPLPLSYTERWTFTLSLEFLRPVCQNCILHTHRKELRETIYYLTNPCFSFAISGLGAKDFRLFSKVFWQRRTTSYVRGHGNTLRKKNLCLKKISFSVVLGLWAKTFPTPGRKTSAGFSKLHEMCPKEIFEEFFFKRKNIFLIISGPWAQRCMSDIVLFSAGVSKTLSTWPYGHFDEE